MQTQKVYRLNEVELLAGISRWRLSYHQKYKGAPKPSIVARGESLYTEEDLNSLTQFFSKTEEEGGSHES
jgi:hypothetical protein